MTPKVARILALLATSSTFIVLAAPANAQSNSSGSGQYSDDTIIVTARRREERLQDVPISITVLNQEQIANRNITNATDLSTYTPSLSANNRFGSDFASFSIRGFTQELRTTASVGVYFAEVVAQRAGNTSVQAGDGAGPGAFFDLENVQVLKGPQGTLFGRNTTGGAIMLTPRKPTDRLEGYVEGSIGDYDMRRLQGVINLPLDEHVRLRVGVDYNKRDGWQHNISGIGPDRLGSTDYVSGRASLVVESGELENYTIGTFTHSQGTADIGQLFACAPPGFGSNAIVKLLAANCHTNLDGKNLGFFDVISPYTNPDPISRIRSWQLINTTTWTASDNLTIKNILSYGEISTRLRTLLFGIDMRIPIGAPVVGGLPFIFSNVNPTDGGDMTDQRNVVEELQFQGRAQDNKLNWQAGFYYEHSTPKSFVGTFANTNIYCPNGGDQTTDPAQIRCQDVVGQYAFGGVVPIGNTTIQKISMAFENIAAYAQATYNFNERFSLTGGVRYTWDKTRALISSVNYTGFPTTTPGPPRISSCAKRALVPAPMLPDCLSSFRQDSKAPTWLIDLDYHPASDVLIYAKYARGYRQGSVVPNGADGLETYKPEKVDSYEIGAKTSFQGTVSGFFNIAGFYNSLTNQQIQIGAQNTQNRVNPTTFIANAGKSRIWGIEVESRVSPLRGLSFDLGYTYLNTKVLKLVQPTPPAGSLYDLITPTTREGLPLTLSPKHKVTITGTYTLPLPKDVGEVSIGATYVYTSSQLATTSSPYGTLAAYDIANVNVAWNSIGGRPIDASLFVTNVFDKHYTSFVSGLFPGVGAEYRNEGLPRMLGARVRIRFGS